MGKEITTGRCIIFGGQLGETEPEITSLICPGDFIICADRGYEYATSLGIKPDLIVGDFDSSDQPDTDIPTIVLPEHKDDTDLHFAACEGIRRGFDSFLLTGVTGGRQDQTAASVFTLNYLVSLGKSAEIVDRHTRMFITERSVTLQRPAYPCWLSVFPLDGQAEGVSISGAEYPLSGARLTNDYPIGVSNRFADDSVTVSVKSGRLLVMIVREEIYA